jgi:tetratricopeptide (TPR) repeat protein
MDTSAVCSQLVKPLLEPTPDWTLADLFDEQAAISAKLRCKLANCFVCHAWRYKFMDVIRSLLELAEQSDEDIYFWFDLCCNNQHRASSLPHEWWTTTFASSVGAIGHTVLLYGPWDDPVPLKRSWCLYELHTSIQQGCEVVVQLMDGGSLKEVLESDPNSITIALSKINSRSAEAWSADDRAKIQRAVEDSIGFQELDVQVMTYLRDSFAKQALQLLSKGEGNLELTNRVAMLLQAQGKMDEAESLYRHALAGREAKLGTDHPDTLMAVEGLATLLNDQNRLDEAESLYRRALGGREAKLGPDHPDTLTSASNLAGLLYAQGKLNEAEPLVRRALAGYEAELGSDHPSTLSSINNLASLLYSEGKLNEAEPLYRRALAGHEAKLGPDHPDTLTSVHNLARLLRSQGCKLDEAESLYRRVLAARQAKLGPDHPGTLTGQLEDRGKLDGAGPLYRRELAGCQAKSDNPPKDSQLNMFAVMLKKAVAIALPVVLVAVLQLHAAQ